MPAEQKLADRFWPDRPHTPREAIDLVIPSLTFALRLTTAAILTFVVTQLYTGGSADLTGALSALLVTQATTSSSIKFGLIRTSAVLIGVTIAVTIATNVGLTWWSLALAIFLSLLIARFLRLGEAILEVAISAMLILQTASIVLAGQEILPAWQRVVMTLIGTGIGMALMLIFPPMIPTKLAAAQVRGVSLAMQRCLRQAAAALMKGPVTKATAAQWLAATHSSADQVSRASRTIRKVSDTRKWNSRAIGVADTVPILRSGLDTFERCLLALRAMFLVIEREANEHDNDGYGNEVREKLAETYTLLGETLAAFGDLVHSEARGRIGDTEDVFRASLVAMRENRDHLAETIVVAPSDLSRWLLRGSILSAIDQILEHLDLQDRTRLRERWELSQAGLRLPEGQIGPKVSSSSRRWIARNRTKASREAMTAQADFLSDNEITQPLPVVRVSSHESTGSRRDQVVAMGELVHSDRSGVFTPPDTDEAPSPGHTSSTTTARRRKRKNWWRII